MQWVLTHNVLLSPFSFLNNYNCHIYRVLNAKYERNLKKKVYDRCILKQIINCTARLILESDDVPKFIMLRNEGFFSV
jgi:hypothetical protein